MVAADGIQVVKIHAGLLTLSLIPEAEAINVVFEGEVVAEVVKHAVREAHEETLRIAQQFQQLKTRTLPPELEAVVEDQGSTTVMVVCCLTSSFHALPQEVQDRIYEKMYESYEITATFRKNAHSYRRYHLNHDDARLVLWGLPKRSMELACKKNLADAEQTRKDGFNGDLGIVYSEEGGDPMTALRDEELTWLRNKVKTIYYGGSNGKSLRYMYPSADWWNEMPGQCWPAVLQR
ncbi:hypothetical protein LTR70_007726 [Exophiala xenobiotica]|uniref:Uncharacterized protein n=1 Tax=Lithohypha guttulata TaxID=1690604 RepID=A0ABR0K560_9EURO|nr:hypothetical protein LTR24_006715 [Lithohypha guttulata]KAK5313209.1 hypothetical protein LTR70_007726 [Exophiala xenobiotica]